MRQARVAGALRARGLEEGGRVAFLVGSSVDLLCAALGCLRSGVIPVMLNPALTAAERTVVLDDCQASAVVGSEAELADLVRARPGELAPWPRARPMHYTSGTTGRPKGVWSGILDDTQARQMHEDEAELWGFEASDVLLVSSPLHHSAPLRIAAAVLGRGGDVVVLSHFDADVAADTLGRQGVTATFMVPAHLQRLFQVGADGRAPIRRANLSGFRLLAHAGAPCPEPLKRRALKAFPMGTVWEFYGSTEGQFTVCSPEEWISRPGTVGRARPGRRLEVDPEGRIWCAPPPFGRFTYWGDAEGSAKAWSTGTDGRRQFSVGDLGRLDGDGYLFIDGRREDLIISGGVNVYPAEVEAALATVPGIGEVVVFGVDDERWGQRVCAAVVGPVDLAVLRAHARRVLADYKRPKDVYSVDDLPRTSTGKVRRAAVAASLGLV